MGRGQNVERPEAVHIAAKGIHPRQIRATHREICDGARKSAGEGPRDAAVEASILGADDHVPDKALSGGRGGGE